MSKETIKELINQGFTVEEALELIKPKEEEKEEALEEATEVEETKEDKESFNQAISSLTEAFNTKIEELNQKLETTLKSQQAINTRTSNIEVNEKKAEDFLGQWLNNGYEINNKEE